LLGTTRETTQDASAADWQFDNQQRIAGWIAGGGLVVLGISPFFKWINLGAGGVIGLSGDGKIVLAATVIAGIAYLWAIIKRKWLTGTFLGIQAWGTLAVFWMGSLIWKVGSILDSANVKDNPFAALFATQITPGAGLYLGLIGGMAVAIGLAFVAVRHFFVAGNLKLFYASQGCSCVLGIVLAVFVGPEAPPKSDDSADPSTAENVAVQSAPMAKEREVPDIIDFGQPFVAPEFQISLVEARVDRPEVKDLFGDVGRGKSPDLILVFRVRNTHERKILRYREENMFLPGHFQLRDDVDNVIRGVSYGTGSKPVGALTGKEDILPGKEATHVELFSVPPPKTRHLILTMDLSAFGADGKARFRIPVEKIQNFTR